MRNDPAVQAQTPEARALYARLRDEHQRRRAPSAEERKAQDPEQDAAPKNAERFTLLDRTLMLMRRLMRGGEQLEARESGD